MSEVNVFHCPHCNEPIGQVRIYTGRRPGRPEGADDTAPRKERRGDINKAIKKALADGVAS